MVKKQVKKLMGFWSEERGLSLFLTILVVEMFVIGPMVRAGLLLGLVSDLLFSLLLLAGVLAVLQHRALQWIAGVLVALAITFKWANITFATPELLFLNGILRWHRRWRSC
jgi:xanthine/uracil permease